MKLIRVNELNVKRNADSSVRPSSDLPTGIKRHLRFPFFDVNQFHSDKNPVSANAIFCRDKY